MSDSPDTTQKPFVSLGGTFDLYAYEEEKGVEPQPVWSASGSYRKQVSTLAIDLEKLFIFSDYVKAWRETKDGTKPLSASRFAEERGLSRAQYKLFVSKVEQQTRDLLHVTHLLDDRLQPVGTAQSLQDIRVHALAQGREEFVAERQADILPRGEMWADLGDYVAKLIEAAKYGHDPDQFAAYLRKRLSELERETLLFSHRGTEPLDWPTEDVDGEHIDDDYWLEDDGPR